MARATRLLVPVLGLTLAVAACGGKQVEETPPPAPEAQFPVTAPAPKPVAVDTMQASDGRTAMLEERIHFGYDRSDLSPEARMTLETKVAILRAAPGLTLRIAGHADERGSDEYNLALSQRRAAEAKRFLVQRGVADARLEAVGYGEEQPMERASTETAWAMNRRADFSVTSGAISQR